MLPFTPLFNLADFRSQFGFDGPAEEISLSKYEDLAIEAVIKEVQSISKKPPCIIASWVIIDLELNDKQSKELAAAGINPTLLYSQFLVDDFRDRWPLASHVYTTPVHRDLGNGLFETGNTLYVLYGKGYRMRMGLDVADRIRASV